MSRDVSPKAIETRQRCCCWFGRRDAMRRGVSVCVYNVAGSSQRETGLGFFIPIF